MNITKTLSIIFVILWMSILFGFSNQPGETSGGLSRKVSEIIINIIEPKDSYTEIEKENAIQTIEPWIRKLAHFSIYTIGGILIANCIFQFVDKERMLILISLFIGILYAISDEIHQLMIAGRSGNIQDVIIDTIGILMGITIYIMIKKL